jgi:hypothetical protein
MADDAIARARAIAAKLSGTIIFNIIIKKKILF